MKNTMRKAKQKIKKTINQRNIDNMKLLISYPEFQKRVREIRMNLSIPEVGIKKYKDMEQWMRDTSDKDDAIQRSPEYTKEEKRIWSLKRQKKITRNEEEILWEKLLHRLPFNFLTDSVREIMADFNIPENYELFIRMYITTGSINAPASNFSATITKKRCVPITIYTRLTDRDLKEIKKYVNGYFGKKLPFVQKVRDVPKKLEVERLYLQGEEYDPVTEKNYKLNNEDIAEKVFGNKKKEKDIYEIVRSLDGLRKRRFGYRKTIVE